MKRLLITIGLLLHGVIFAQTDQLNLDKYWKFRNNLKEKFVKIGPSQGESLPAGALLPLDCVDNVNSPWQGYGEMRWGDGMIRHGHYLGLLATEYKLLKNSRQDLTGVLNELYYALNVINRLDKEAESSQDNFYGYTLPDNQNGFYLREDVPEDFAAQNWGTDKLRAGCTNSVFYQNNNAAKVSGGPSNYINRGNSYQNVPSADQMTSLMVGLSLVHKLVDDIYVKPTPTDVGFSIISETKQIVNRMMIYASAHNWFLIDVNGWPVANGGGDLCYAAYPLTQAANRILGTTNYNPYFVRVDFNYGNVQHCITGFGSDDSQTQSAACASLNNAQNNKKSLLLANGVNDGFPINNQNTSVFQSWQFGNLNSPVFSTNNDLVLTIPTSASAGVWNGLLASASQVEFFNNFGSEKYIKDYVKTIIFNLGVVSGDWDQNEAKEWALVTGNYQLELINALLTNTMPVNGFLSFRSFLDVMPNGGAYKLRAGEGENNSLTYNYQTNGWAGEYKWTNPSQAVGIEGETGIFNNIDYMLFHNLYRLIFQPTGSFAPSSNCLCGSPITVPLTGTSAQISAKQSLNSKLSHVETCSKDVFESVNQIVSGQFTLVPKFPNYIDLNIYTDSDEVNNATITSSGNLQVRNRFVICNSKTLTLQNGGLIAVEKGALVINPNSKLNSNGEIRVKSGTSLFIKGLGKLVLNSTSKLIIEDGAKLIIEAGGNLEYYSGAQIITQGENSEIVMQGNIKMMNAGTFTIDHSASASSGRIIFDGGIFTAEQAGTIINLNGKNRNDEFVIIKPTRKIWIQDTDISLFRLYNCKIDLPTGSEIWVQQPFKSINVIYFCATNCLGIQLTEQADFTDVILQMCGSKLN